MRISRNVAIFVLGALAALGAAWSPSARCGRGPPTRSGSAPSSSRASRAVEEKRPGDAMAAVSERFQGEGMGHRELQAVHHLPGAARLLERGGARWRRGWRWTGDRAEAVVDVGAGPRGEGGGRSLGRLPEAGDTWRIEATPGAGEGRVEGGLGPRWPRSSGRSQSPEMIFQPVPVALEQEALDVGVALGDLVARGRDPVLGVVEEVGLALVAVHDDVGDAELDADLGDAREGVAEDPGERLVVDVVRRRRRCRSRRSRRARRAPSPRRCCGCRRPSGRRPRRR